MKKYNKKKIVSLLEDPFNDNPLKEYNGTIKDGGKRLASNKSFVLYRVGIDGLELRYASLKLQDDEEVVFTAVNQNGLALAYASKRIQSLEHIFLAAIENNEKAREFGSKDLQKK